MAASHAAAVRHVPCTAVALPGAAVLGKLNESFQALQQQPLGPVDVLALSCSKQRDSTCVLAAKSWKLTLDFWVIWGLKVSWASAWRCWGEGSR